MKQTGIPDLVLCYTDDATLHEYIAQVKEARKARKLEPGLKITAYLDPIVDSGYLKTPKTARPHHGRADQGAEERKGEGG